MLCDRCAGYWRGVRKLRVRSQLLTGELCETNYGGEHVVEIMCNPSGKPSHAFQLLRMEKLRFQLLSLADVAGIGRCGNYSASGAEDWRNRNRHVYRRPVAADTYRFQFRSRYSVGHTVHYLRKLITTVCRYKHGDRAADHL